MEAISKQRELGPSLGGDIDAPVHLGKRSREEVEDAEAATSGASTSAEGAGAEEEQPKKQRKVSEKKFFCPRCGAGYVAQKGLDKHLDKTHPEREQEIRQWSEQLRAADEGQWQGYMATIADMEYLKKKEEKKIAELKAPKQTGNAVRRQIVSKVCSMLKYTSGMSYGKKRASTDVANVHRRNLTELFGDKFTSKCPASKNTWSHELERGVDDMFDEFSKGLRYGGTLEPVGTVRLRWNEKDQLLRITFEFSLFRLSGRGFYGY
eukprot:TRINITY_DN13260_c0_g1_i1.p1 TRINITY_DN13260_c0_g1~~TRINITY_DN13260_c0_g1_i1.p1  ORF type:complete len:264 (+),score=92.78 TRINITY_DN13260_c0_g1_i1:137-928(+)